MFGPTTRWIGTTVDYEGGTSVLRGHGASTAADAVEYERQGHL